ncbi:hypothetical protein SPFM9_00235 [Salmonella phage SPFM9]|nr:hypothetical protein SPFM9_00235 [Salmonella phage SPFM9]
MKPFRGFLDAIFDCANSLMKPIQAQEDAIEEERQNAQREAMPKVMTLAESMMEHPELTAEDGMKLGNITKVIRRIPILNAQLEISEDPLQDFGTLFDTMLGVTDTAVELVIAFGLVATPAVPVTYNGNNYLQMEDTPFAAHQYKAAVDTLRLKKGEEIKFIGDLLFTLDNVDGVKPELYEVGLQVWLREINKRKLPRRMAVGAILQATNGFKIILSPIQFTMKTINLLTLANGSIERSEDELPR